MERREGRLGGSSVVVVLPSVGKNKVPSSTPQEGKSAWSPQEGGSERARRRNPMDEGAMALPSVPSRSGGPFGSTSFQQFSCIPY